MQLSEISIDSSVSGGSPQLAAYLGVPTGEGPWPAVVMVHEAFGVTDIMKRQIQRMAASGFLVIMPDLFSAGGARKCLTATFRAMVSGEGRAYIDIDLARQFLLGRPDCTGRVGILGFCMGGGFALMMAGRGFDASSANYGRLPKDMDSILAGACPIVGSYGGRDDSLKGAAARLETTLVSHGVIHDVKEYHTAGHSFLNDSESGPVLLRPILRRVLGAGPDPVAAADAWHRIDAFFGEHLGAPGDATGSNLSH
ncbi:MAG: dienelactone hydrolase family protein [Microbacteriaceae bacterium]|nr:dienelactone hydrolase family protein [Microbacteriaceae bacterium]